MFIHQLFEQQALKTPDRVAAFFEAQPLTYGALNTRANQLAHYLRSLGVGREVIVGICLERCHEFLIALLGVLKAGGACLPLDPNYPPERLAFLSREAQAFVFLTEQRLAARFDAAQKLRSSDSHGNGSAEWLGKTVVFLDVETANLQKQKSDAPSNAISTGNLSFIFYTSGSTGHPKAVMWYHSERDSLKSWQERTYQLTEHDYHLIKAPIGFTLISKEVFLPLLTGGKAIIVPNGLERDPAYLIKLIVEHQVSIVTVVPSMLRALLEQEGLEQCSSLRHVCTFGETLAPHLQQRFYQRLSAELNIVYGATEAPSATFFSCDRGDVEQRVVLGKPLPEKNIYVLDSQLKTVGLGDVGEICVTGNLARGYLGHPDLTAEKFVPNPMSEKPGGRLYKTGDSGRYLPDGCIEFIGRVDRQIKIRGVRVEPAEVEQVIRQHAGVVDALLVAQKNRAGHSRLIAYIVPGRDWTPSIQSLRRHIAQQLPDYLIPAGFVFLEALPINHHGKLDRAALPVPANVRPELDTEFIAPNSLVEKQIAEIWREVLSLDCVGVNDHFLELGGDSLLAAQVIQRITKRFHLDLPVRSLLHSPSVAGMAAIVAKQQELGGTTEELGCLLAELENLSESEAQRLLTVTGEGKNDRKPGG